ncbi:hypothetical protein [Shouchella patagoniensis]|uniref:hypothetical protein n=1 Tax=Shouchella patagoniensis TaxID=228576 RepID=UPI000995D653|nr:hypothetical protein [Shouchella patagoniensis]
MALISPVVELGSIENIEVLRFEDGTAPIMITTYAVTGSITVKVYDNDDAELVFGECSLWFPWTLEMQRVMEQIDHYEALELLSIFAAHGRNAG